ncbi:Acyl-CoA synthetase (NDP forming) [Rhizobiales bacterium GAS113]|nr:Acyl-CoA synthetase (NDP forming) [Rhizobiales bacterium GAS113]
MSTDRDDAVARLLRPRSVAVVGASEKPGAPTSFVMRNLIGCGFRGAIHPVHPTAQAVFGLPAVKRLCELPQLPDTVLIGVAAERVLGVLDEAGQIGIKAAVILASGFAEIGPSGRALQATLAETARRHGMAVCGPNCLGLFDVHTGLALYSSRLAPIEAGNVAIVSHSGALGIALAHSGRLRLSMLISAGNAAVTDFPDYLSFLAGDARTDVVGLVMEKIGNPEAFSRATAAMHAAGKPVIVLRLGRSQKGAAASAAHTGSLAGSDEAFLDFFRRCGVIVVDDADEFIETAALLSRERRRPRSKGLALIGVSGGSMAHVSDVAEQVGLDLPELSPPTVATLSALLPAYATPQNPLDVTGIVFAEPGIYRAALQALAADPNIGVVAAVQDVPAGLDDGGAEEYRGIAAAIAEHRAHAATPSVVISNLAAGPHAQIARALDAADIPVLHGTRAALKAIRSFGDLPCPALAPAGLPLIEAHPRWTRRFVAGKQLTEREAKMFLADHGLTVTRELPARSREAAVAAAREIGFPVVMKIESPDIAHKTEAGGVHLGVADADGAAIAYDAIMVDVAAKAPTARLEGVVIQEMVEGGVEALIGVAMHETFGPTLLVGTGGVLVEFLRDSAVAVLPIGRAAAHQLVGRTRLAHLIAGYRGAPEADLEAFVDAILGIGAIATAYAGALSALELNPIAILPKGKGVRVLDALIIASGGKG